VEDDAELEDGHTHDLRTNGLGFGRVGERLLRRRVFEAHALRQHFFRVDGLDSGIRASMRVADGVRAVHRVDTVVPGGYVPSLHRDATLSEVGRAKTVRAELQDECREERGEADSELDHVVIRRKR
jgi:hypothetical protein